MTVDFYLDAIRILKAKGMTTLEAVEQFREEGKPQWEHAIAKALCENLGTEVGRELLDVLAKAGMEECNESALEQAYELWMAGWTHEPVSPNSQVMSWYWRAPPKGKRPRGRRYLSTQQALNALRRSGR